MKTYSKQDFITADFPSLQEMKVQAAEISKDWQYGQTAFCRERGRFIRERVQRTV